MAPLLLLWHVYISLLSLHLAGPASLPCFEFSLKLISSSFSFTEERLARLLVNAHPLSRRRLQLTIVGFHHRHECTASLVMACQRIFFTPLSYCLSFVPSFMPSFSPPSRLIFTCSGYGLLYCQTHFLHYVPVHIYIHLNKVNVNTDQTFAVTFNPYQLQKQIVLSCVHLFPIVKSNSTFSFSLLLLLLS